MRAFRRALSLGLMFAAILAPAAGALAGNVAFDATFVRRDIKACILNAGGNANPNLFIALQKASLKPSGWNFVNPLAPVEASGGLVPSGVGNGWAMLSTFGAYWQMPTSAALSTTTDLQRLAGMDVIYTCQSTVNVPANVDAGLIHAVEGGALLWIDHVSGNYPGVTRLQPPRCKSSTAQVPFTFAAPSATGLTPTAVNPVHEVFNTPFPLTATDISSLGSAGDSVVWPGPGGQGDTDAKFRALIALLDGGGNTQGMAAVWAPYGAGAILVTTSNIGGPIANLAGTNGVLGPNDPALPKVKFAYNVIAWAMTQRQQGAAGALGGVSALQAPVEIKWQYPRSDRRDPVTGNAVHFGPVVAAPLLFEGRLYVLSLSDSGGGPAMLTCLDPNPGQDNCSNGSDYTVIWQYSFPGGQTPRTSAPVGVYCKSPLTATDQWNYRPAILVATTGLNPAAGTGGNITCIWGDTGQWNWAQGVAGYNNNARVCDISTPVVSNGWVYFTASEFDNGLVGSANVVDGTYGRAWCFDLAYHGVLSGGGASGAYWVYPEPDLTRGKGNGTAVFGEPERSLPCFNDPVWVAAVGSASGSELPRVPTAAPVVTSNATLQDGTIVDSLMVAHSPTSRALIFDGSNPASVCVDGFGGPLAYAGGSEIAFVPTATGTDSGGNPYDRRLNANYYCVQLAANQSYTWAEGKVRGDTGASGTGKYPLAAPLELNPTGTTGTLHFNGANQTGDGVRQVLAQWAMAAINAWADKPWSPGDLVYSLWGGRWVVFLCKGSTAGQPATSTQPGQGSDWQTYWTEFHGLGPWESQRVQLWQPGAWKVGDLVAQWLSGRADTFLCIQATTTQPGVSTSWQTYWTEAGARPVYGGCDVDLALQGSGTVWSSYSVPTPVLWQRQYSFDDAPTTRSVVSHKSVITASGIPITGGTGSTQGTPTSGGASSRLTALDMENGWLKWRLDPRGSTPPLGSPPGVTDRQALITSAAALGNDTTLVAVTEWATGGPANNANNVAPRSALLGLRQHVDLQMHLGPGVDDAVGIQRGTTPVVDFLELTGDIDPIAYEVDYARRVIKFKPELAANVPIIGDSTTWSHPVAGKALLVSWTDTTGKVQATELHVLPAAQSFSYVPGFIKLDKYPVDWGTVRVLLPNGTPNLNDKIQLKGVQPGEPTVSYDYGTGKRTLLPNGWLDLRGAYVDRNNNNVFDAGDISALGLNVIVAYTGYFEAALGWDWKGAGWTTYPVNNGFTPVPNPGLSLSVEPHQVPVQFGRSFGAPTLAGNTILLGTEGISNGNSVLEDWLTDFEAPAGGMYASETLLALTWNPATSEVSGRMVQPAQDDSGAVPIVRAPATAIGDRAAVGSAGMKSIGPPDSSAGTRNGYVSVVGPEGRLIAAGSRIIECVGTQPVRVYTGSRPSTGAAAIPFGQVAKASRTASGILVVDAGNNEVFEMTRDGVRIWPTGVGSDSPKMQLSRPTDAWRYYTNWVDPTDGLNHQWSHTVIADAGNKRIVEWVSTQARGPAGQQMWCFVVTPDRVPGTGPGEMLALEYQKAEPIFDPATRELWGYLACASNWTAPLIIAPPTWDNAGNYYPAVVDPTGAIRGARVGLENSVATISTGAVWDNWTFLYGLRFTAIRHVDLTRAAGTPYVAVVASTYSGSATVLYGGAADEQMGVFEFPVPATNANIANPYRFTRHNYVATGHASVALPGGGIYYKGFFPTCAKRLGNGDYLIANYVGAPDNMNTVNVGVSAWGEVLGSEVFRVLSATNAVLGRQMIPDPGTPPWTEPLSQVPYVDRF